MEQVFQVGGALAILAAFVATQVGVWRTTSWSYLTLNLAGSLVLAVVAALDDDWGFLLLEAVWALVSAWSMANKARRSRRR